MSRNRTRSPRHRDHDRGLAAAVEMALLVTLLVVVAGVIVGAGRAWYARSVVSDTAAAAARSASLERSGTNAAAVARTIAASGLQSAGVTCGATNIAVDTSGFSRPVGTPATVTVTITCDVAMGDILVPGWPGHISITHTATSTLDRFRERQP